MITNVGKSIMAKYLIGQAPSYASHIAIGCGAKPKDITEPFDDYSEKKDLEFEMLRAPIVSRGYVTEDGVSKIVFTAEMPTQERYEITEIGLYPAGSNQYAVGYDSRVLYYFTRQEPWKYQETLLTTIDAPLDEQNTNNDIDQYEDISLPEAQRVAKPKIIQTNATNKVFANAERQLRSEQSRFLNNMVLIRGDFSGYDSVTNAIPAQSLEYISLSPVAISLEKNAPTDKLKFAFSIINVDGNVADAEFINPAKAQFRLDFVTTSGKTAKFSGEIVSNLYGGEADFSNNRYYVVSADIDDLVRESGFSWNTVNSIRVYANVLTTSDGVTFTDSDKFYFAADAIRLDNLNSYNPLYGLTAYTTVKSVDARPIVKLPNTTSLVEFRLGIGV